MSEATIIVDKQLEYYNDNDLEGFLSTYTQDITIYNLNDNSIMLKGIDALREKYRERFEIQKVKANITNRITIGNKVIDHEEVSGIEKDKLVKAVAIYQVENNLISKVWFAFD